MVSEDIIRRLTLEAIEQLGSQATTSNVQRVVERAVSQIEGGVARSVEKDSGRIIITAYGYNSPGIIATISGILARHNCDILDMTQKLLQEFFTLMMIVDISKSSTDYPHLSEELTASAEKMKMRLLVQHEDVFNAMHRI